MVWVVWQGKYKGNTHVIKKIYERCQKRLKKTTSEDNCVTMSLICYIINVFGLISPKISTKLKRSSKHVKLNLLTYHPKRLF